MLFIIPEQFLDKDVWTVHFDTTRGNFGYQGGYNNSGL